MDVNLDAWRRAAAARGLDLLAPFSVARARAELGDALALLPDLGRDDPLGLVLGNTRAAWPRFREALVLKPGLRSHPDPFDAWITGLVVDLVRVLDTPAWIALEHEPERRLPIQRLAELAGLAQLGPAHLAVHPVHGPWISLRAVLVLDADAPSTALTSARPCDGCPAPCVAALKRALRAGTPRSQAEVAARWRDWVAIRDACPVGGPSRFEPDQVEYHYRQDRSLLQP